MRQLAILGLFAALLAPGLAAAQNVGQCPCHAGGGQCICNPASRCPNCPPSGRAAPAAAQASASVSYGQAGYDSRLCQVRPGERVVLACAPALRVEVVQDAPVVQLRIQQRPRQYVIEVPQFEPPVVRFDVQARFDTRFDTRFEVPQFQQVPQFQFQQVPQFAYQQAPRVQYQVPRYAGPTTTTNNINIRNRTLFSPSVFGAGFAGGAVRTRPGVAGASN
jgi:hypothetical protein